MTTTAVRIYGKDVGEPLPVDVQYKLTELGSISAVIRYYRAEGMKTGDIARLIGRRFQHVRNVLNNPPKKG